MSRRLALLAALTGGVVALTGCGSVYDVPLPGGADVGPHPITVRAEFRDVLDLVPQSSVKVDDVTVGKVTKVALHGYTAEVTLALPRDVHLPDDATAQIRQTSLLGEKFVSLAAPDEPSSGRPANRLGDGDVIPLSRTGRNPEVEEVLGALSLILNGGGVGQLKTIAAELNQTLDGREGDVRSVLAQLRTFTGQLAANKADIVRAIDSLDRLAASLRKQDGSIRLALDDLPAAIRSVDGQRRDLVRTLKALSRLSDVGVRVIEASKTSTVNSLRDLAPVLSQLAAAGQDVPNSVQALLTYPFVDASIGRDPQVARNLHLGDYTNLNARLDLDLSDLPDLPEVPVPALVGTACKQVEATVDAAAADVVHALPTPPISAKQKRTIRRQLVARTLATIDCDHPGNLTKKVGRALPAILKALGVDLDALPDLPIPGLPGGLGGLTDTVGGLGGGVGGGVGGGLGLGRTPTAYDVLDGPRGTAATLGYNSTLGSLLLQGVAR